MPLFRRRRPAPIASDGDWPLGTRPAEPVFSIVSEPRPERPPRPRPPRATVALQSAVPPVEVRTPGGDWRWLAEFAAIAPLVLILAPTAHDMSTVQALCAGLRESGAQVLLATRDGEAGTPSCPAAFEVLGEGNGGLFVLDTGGVLRLSYPLPHTGAWLPSGVVRARLRRLAAG